MILVKATANVARLVLACLVLIASGCTAGDDRAATAPDTAAWRVDATPRTAIGVVPAPAHELDRVYAGLVRPDGSVLIGNSGTAELRLFDRAGTHRLTAGRKGMGPGEFQGIHWIRPFRGDSVLVFDMRAQRFSVWTAAGAFGRTFRVQDAQRSTRPIGIFSDGSILVAAENQYDPRQGPGVVRDQMVLSRITPTGGAAGEVGRLPGAEWLLYDHPGNFRSTQLPFGRQGHVAVSGDYFVYGSSESNRLSVYDRSGRQIRTIEVPAASRPGGRAAIREHLAGLADVAEREALRRHYEAHAGAVAPAFSDIRADRDGNLWVQTPGPDDATSRWIVLTLSGDVTGSVMLPAGALPLDLLPGAMLVRETDEDGVQRVFVREVRR